MKTSDDYSFQLDEEAVYAAAMSEVNSDTRRPGVWAKALADSDGDENRSKALYIRLRVQQEKHRIQRELEVARMQTDDFAKVEGDAFAALVKTLRTHEYIATKERSDWIIRDPILIRHRFDSIGAAIKLLKSEKRVASLVADFPTEPIQKPKAANVEKLFNIALTGSISGSRLKVDVADKLSTLLKVSKENAIGLLGQTSTVVKKNVSFDIAQKYRVALEATGAAVNIIPASEVHVDAGQASDVSERSTAGVGASSTASPSRTPPSIDIATPDDLNRPSGIDKNTRIGIAIFAIGIPLMIGAVALIKQQENVGSPQASMGVPNFGSIDADKKEQLNSMVALYMRDNPQVHLRDWESNYYKVGTVDATKAGFVAPGRIKASMSCFDWVEFQGGEPEHAMHLCMFMASNGFRVTYNWGYKERIEGVLASLDYR